MRIEGPRCRARTVRGSHISIGAPAVGSTCASAPKTVLFSSAAGGENSRDLASVLGLTESTVSHHLSQLRNASLVESERRGMNVIHTARRDALIALCSVLDPNCCT